MLLVVGNVSWSDGGNALVLVRVSRSIAPARKWKNADEKIVARKIMIVAGRAVVQSVQCVRGIQRDWPRRGIIKEAPRREGTAVRCMIQADWPPRDYSRRLLCLGVLDGF